MGSGELNLYSVARLDATIERGLRRHAEALVGPILVTVVRKLRPHTTPPWGPWCPCPEADGLQA